MKLDPQQNTNVYEDPHYARVISELDKKLADFFAQYSKPEYDLWTGGVAKGSVDRPEMFRKLYGDDWRAQAEVKPAFAE